MTTYRTEKRTTWMKAVLILASLVFVLLLGNTRVSAATYKESDYSHVYDYSYYVTKHPKATKGMSRSQALTHFVTQGMKKGWTGSSEFVVDTYKRNYPVIAKQYGTNLKLYYLHYQKYGYAQGRIADKLLSKCYFNIQIDPAGGKYNGTTKITKVNQRYSTTYTLQTPTRSGYDFKGWTKTGRGTLTGSTFKFTNTMKGDTVIKASWTKKASSVARYAYAYRIADVAKTQLGNHAETYWQYFKADGLYDVEWCCEFVSWCAYKAGLIDEKAGYCSFGAGHFPKTASQRELSSMFKKRGQLKLASSGYIPQTGDIIFFSNATDKSDTESYRHVGIVVGRNVTNGYVITIEGNTGTYNRYTSYVKRKTYEFKSDKIAAYGIIA